MHIQLPNNCRLPIADCRLIGGGGSFGNRKSEIGNSRAFTLIEMMVVITVIVLAMTLAVPAIRSLTGSRSQEAAQNVLTTALGAARAEAMALQRVEGIMFFLDTSSDRIMCVEVMETPGQANDNAGNLPVPGPVYLDMVPERDPLYLPTGIWLFTMKDRAPTTPTNLPDTFDSYRYLGYNAYSGNTAGDYSTLNPPIVNVPGGVILFDATGRLVVRPYGFRFTTGSSATPTQIGQFLYPSVAATALTTQSWPSSAASPWYLASQIGLCLADRETFVNASDGNGGTFTAVNKPGAVAKVTSDWLDTNTTPIFVNRYDGTLMRAE